MLGLIPFVRPAHLDLPCSLCVRDRDDTHADQICTFDKLISEAYSPFHYIG